MMTRPFQCCFSTLKNLLFARRVVWSNVIQDLHKTGNIGPVPHGNLGKKNRSGVSKVEGARVAVVNFLDEVAKQVGEPYATQFIRLKMGIGIRGGDVDLVELPTFYTKRRLYRCFLWAQGYKKPKSFASGYGRLGQYKKRTDDEWPRNVQPGPICSWSGFQRVWREERGNTIRIKNKSEDVCGDCFKFTQCITLVQRARGLDNNNNNNSGGGDNNSNNNNGAAVATGAATSNGDDDDDDGGDGNGDDDDGGANNNADMATGMMEDMISQASAHVNAARAMRAYVNEMAAKAKQDRENNVRHSKRQYTIVMDYAQNLDLPHFGNEQPSETYYYTPQSIFIFGINDMSLDHLHAYVYPEDRGKKDANAVSSLLLHYLKERGIIMKLSRSGKVIRSYKLTIACDNCAGQNKNNVVLRLPLLLVELGFFKEVEIVFFVRGHTKNACNRSFNILKQGYHNRNIYTFDSPLEGNGSMVQVLNQNRGVTVISTRAEWFKDYETYLDRLYRKYSSGQIQGSDDGRITESHVFRCNHDTGPTTIYVKPFEGHPYHTTRGVSIDLKKRLSVNEDRRVFLVIDREIVPAPVMANIKRVGLFKQWRRLVPDPYKDITCPQPPDDMIKSVTAESNKKNSNRQQKKKTTKAQHKEQKKQQHRESIERARTRIAELTASTTTAASSSPTRTSTQTNSQQPTSGSL